MRTAFLISVLSEKTGLGNKVPYLKYILKSAGKPLGCGFFISLPFDLLKRIIYPKLQNFLEVVDDTFSNWNMEIYHMSGAVAPTVDIRLKSR